MLVTNWHAFAPESEQKEGDATYRVVNKGAETPEAFAKRVLGDLYDRMPIMVLNDEGHHCWRPAPLPESEDLDRDEQKELEAEAQEATVWIDGLDRLNNAMDGGKGGIAFCMDLSATPFYIKGSGYPEGRPFPWLVSDFGLVDAIESGIVKIPRLPVLDTTGRPDPKYFRLWKAINDSVEPGERLPGRARKPKPDVVYREAEGALQQIEGLWRERFRQIQEAKPGQEQVPPVLIIVCDNTDIARVLYEKISGEREDQIVTPEDVEEAVSDDETDTGNGAPSPARKSKRKTRTIYGQGAGGLELFWNTPDQKRTIRIDSKLLAEAEGLTRDKSRQEAGEELRRVVATVGKPGLPGEHVRCVVSVAMLTEGWDANNVTQILGIRAFSTQLLCEQVVGRGLRRLDYVPDPETGLLTEEYVDVYGIPFSVVPFKGRTQKQGPPDDKPKNHVRALPERALLEMRFPVVEGYAFALKKNLIRCDVEKMEGLELEPNREPTATFVLPTVGYREGAAAQLSTSLQTIEQNRESYYREVHIQTIEFEIARAVLEQLTGNTQQAPNAKQRVLRLQSRHQLFPQIYGYVKQYVASKVNFKGCHSSELGLEKYVMRIVERLRDAIVPDEAEGEPPLLPILNRYKPIGTTAEVDFKTTRPCFGTQRSHINQVVADTFTWESSAAFYLERSKAVKFYARNDHLGLLVPYDYMGVSHNYDPDFLVRLADDTTLILEIKGLETDQDRAKHSAARRWVSAVNNWGQLGRWELHVCRDPQWLDKELSHILTKAAQAVR